MRDLIIVGAGGTSREIADAVAAVNEAGKASWNLLGFLDDDPNKAGRVVNGYPVLGGIDSARSYQASDFIVGVANPREPTLRRRVVERIGCARERFATVIHPSACVSRYAQIGLGTAILQNVVITPDTKIGDHVLILQNVAMAHDDVVGDFVTIAPGAVIAGSVSLRSGVYVGAGSTIMQHITVHEEALIGVGSVVLSDVPRTVTVMGYPARPLPKMQRH